MWLSSFLFLPPRHTYICSSFSCTEQEATTLTKIDQDKQQKLPASVPGTKKYSMTKKNAMVGEQSGNILLVEEYS